MSRYVSKAVDAVQNDFKTDPNWNRIFRLTGKGIRKSPPVAGRYLLDKVPIVGWLPRYNYRWLASDFIAGLTLGLMLIPQGLSYAKLATIPVQYGLMSSWIPGVLYAFMGTTKDLSTGPTSLIGILTAEVIDGLEGEYTASEIASAIAMMMGIYGAILGFLKLGFLLELISLPILNGFISAVAITIILNQMDSLLGESGVRDGTAHQIHDVLQKLPQANGLSCAVGFTGILMLTILERCGRRWGKKNRIVWFLSITRAFLCLVLYTGISFAVNKHRKDNPLFDIVKVQADGIETPRVPKASLLGKVAGRSIAIFVGAAVEHTAIARAFAVRNNYITDQSQELSYFGLVNIVNSFFHSMGVGGAMSRTAVNSSCNVRSPLSGIVTMAVVLISIYKLVGTLYWIPKATLAAIIITAVWPLISSPRTFYRIWKVSLADFISSMIAFWVSMFKSTEIGIASSVGFNIAYCLVRQTFTRVVTEGNDSPAGPGHDGEVSIIPADSRVFRLKDAFFFLNAHSIKSQILDAAQIHHSPAYSSLHGTEADRNWSVVSEKRLARLRKKAHIEDPSTLPRLRLIVINFTRVTHADYTAVSQLHSLYTELRRYAGSDVEMRFVGMSNYVWERFERGKFEIVEADIPHDGEEGISSMTLVRHFKDEAEALSAQRWDEARDNSIDEKKASVARIENA